MRVLWVDADGSPWTDSNGWRVLEDFGLSVSRVSSVAEAQQKISENIFDLFLVRAEMADASAFLVEVRRAIGEGGSKIVLASSTWSKDQFRAHSKTAGAAHRYARVPMPPEGFLNLVTDLFGCTVDELADFEVGGPSEVSSEQAEEEAPAPKARKPRRNVPAPAPGENGDLDVLRKYLAIREEQLEISEGEREELSHENERLQKEAHQLQLKLREFEHMQEELGKKLEQMQEEKAESERKVFSVQEEAERNVKFQGERVKGLEVQVADASEKYESLRARVRKDIRKIRENERDLEARLELMRKDSETLLQARDVKVLELQRKIDALEFDLDQIQDSRVQAQLEAERYLAKLSRVSRALQIANHMIEDDRASEAELDELEPFAGGAANAEEEQAAAATEKAAPEAPSAAQPPPAEEEALEPIPDQLSPELAALANDGEATQMISMDQLPKAGGDSES